MDLTGEPSAATLTAEAITKRFGATVALDGASLHVHAGECVALVGESGAGKTVLLRTVLGVFGPSERMTGGEVRFRGEPLRRDRRHLREHRRHVQMVFQDPTGALNPRQTIYEAVAEGLRIQSVPGNEEELVARALARSGLRPPERFFTRYPYEVSGGQRQRVVIAGAMVLEPALLVADEPVSSLDASVRGEILALMQRLVRETWPGTSPIGSPSCTSAGSSSRAPRSSCWAIRAIPTPARCCPWCRRASTSTRRSSAARRPTRPASHPGAASTPAARWWPRARRVGSAYSPAASARTWG
jgi:ABC-type dipeptide/oligopeptide/nickel transport system ATPase subunit